MAGQADGSIYVNTELDPEGFKAGSDRMKTAVKSLETQVNKLGPALRKAVNGKDGGMETYRTQAEEAEAAIAEMEEELEALGHKQIETDEFKDINAELKKLDEELTKCDKKIERFFATGGSEDSSAFRKMKYDVEQIMKNLDRANAEKQQMLSSGTAYMSGTETARYAELESRIAGCRDKLEEYNWKADEAAKKGHRIADAFKRVGAVIGSAAKAVGGVLVTGLRSALGVTKRLITGNKNYNSSFGKLISAAKRFSLTMLGARAVYTILRKAVQSYMDANTQLSTQLSSAWTSLGNILGPIITKIINLVCTAISYVTALLKLFGFTAKAANKTAAAAGGAGDAAKEAAKTLTGFDEINAMADNSDSGGGGGGGGADMSAELEDATLPDWVQMMIDQLKAGEWEAAALTLTDKLNEMVAGVDWAGIGDKIGYYLNGALTFLATALLNFDWQALGSDLALMLNHIITSVDWGNLGVLLMGKLIILLQGLTGFFQTLDGTAVSNGIHQFLTGAITAVDWVSCTGALSSAISGFISDINFNQIGKDLSTGVRTFLQSIISAIDNFDWKMVGTKIADFINGIDWGGIIGDLVSLVSSVLDAGLDTLLGLVETIDWGQLGDEIWEALVNLCENTDWNGIISKAFELLGAAIAGAASLVATIGIDFWEMFKQGLSDAWSSLQTYIDEAGGNIIEGLWNGIKNALSNVGTWIVENIWNPFIEGFKNAFGIHSPSTKMAEQGGFIIEGLLQGITNAWSSITEWFSEAWNTVKDITSTAWESVKTTVSNAWSSVKSTVTSVGAKVKEKVSDAWTNVKDTVSSKLDTTKEKASAAWESIKSTANTIGNTIKTNATTAWTNVKTNITNSLNTAKSNASTAWNSIKSTASTIGSNIASAASTAWTNVKNYVTNNLNTAKSNASSAWSSMKSTLSSTASSMSSTITDKFNSIKSTITDKVNNAKSTVSTGFSNIKSSITSNIDSAMSAVRNGDWGSIGSNIVYGLGNGLSNTWYWLRNKASTLASNLLSSVKNMLGIASPSKVFRDEVGYFIGLGVGEGIENSEGSVLDSVSGIADAISEEFSEGDYAAVISGAELDSPLADFTDKITASFDRLLDKLQAIANNVTFSVPAVVGKVTPYASAAQSEKSVAAVIDASNDELARTFESSYNRQNALLKEQNNLLRQILSRSTGGTNTIGSNDILGALERKNRRDGKTVVPVGV